MIPPQSYLTWAIIITPFHVVSISSTIFRLHRRYTARRLWWDDYVAAFAMFFDFMSFVVYWVRYNYNNPGHTLMSKVILYWLSSLPFLIIVWSSRISLALSLTRLLQPEQRKMRMFTKGLAIAFGVICIALLLQEAIVCGADSSWHQSPNIQCSGVSWVSSLTTDIIGDTTLIVAPLVMLWRIKLPQKQRQMIRCVFCASIVTALASITVHTFLLGAPTWGTGAGKILSGVCHFETTIALFVSNLLVVVAYFYQRFRPDEHGDSDEYDEKTDFPTLFTTTVQNGTLRHRNGKLDRMDSESA